MSNNTLANTCELKAGDILLCYKNAKVDPVGKKITKITDSDYTHAAICIDTNTVAESLVVGGVRKTDVNEFVARYEHIAIFRQPDAWRSKSQVDALNIFISSIIKIKAKYNLKGVLSFRERKDIHQLSQTEQLEAFFDGKLSEEPVVKGSYFCSELVADCFVASGFIDPSAAVIYKSSTTSPGALGRDPTFGTFYGYLSSDENYVIPSTDEFINVGRYDEIFSENA